MTRESTSGSSQEFFDLQAALAGRYSLERELGRGGMGIVFLARDVALDRMVALKLLPPDLASTPALRDRFLREARTAARLSHPNIVPIFAVDEVDGFVFFVMAYIKGHTLGDRIRERGPLPHAEATRILREVSWALGHAHLQGIVHRDVKPDNILLEEGTGRAMVTDFGIAVLAEEGATKTGNTVQGTAEFMSPEQARGGEVDARSDLYSLACVGYYALTGRVPFSGPTPEAVLGMHLCRPAPRLATSVAHLNPSVSTALDRCLRKEPELRYSGGEALADALLPDLELDKELPVPLRVFIKQTRATETVSAWSGLGLLFFAPGFIGTLLSGDPLAALSTGLLTALFAGLPGWHLVRAARRLLASGYTLADAVAAMEKDMELREEEFRFQVGRKETWVDRSLQMGMIGGFSLMGLSLYLQWLGVSIPVAVPAWSFVGGGISTLLREIRKRARSDAMGERWLKFWKGSFGKLSFKMAGFRLKRVAAQVAGIHRSTEIVIALAADRLFEELPQEVRKSLKDLPETVKALEDDAQGLRRQVSELDGVLAEIGDDDPAAPSPRERARVRADVEEIRNQARKKLQEAVAALETIRLGLLRMHAGDETVESLTMELDAARDLSRDMEHLLEGHREVERVLQERRKTGFFALPGSPEAGE